MSTFNALEREGYGPWKTVLTGPNSCFRSLQINGGYLILMASTREYQRLAPVMPTIYFVGGDESLISRDSVVMSPDCNFKVVWNFSQSEIENTLLSLLIWYGPDNFTSPMSNRYWSVSPCYLNIKWIILGFQLTHWSLVTPYGVIFFIHSDGGRLVAWWHQAKTWNDESLL